MKYPKISAIIATYNAMKWAERCFSSLRKSSVPVGVIVVDNGSTDGTQKFIQINFPEVHLIQSNENLGFGKANNLGIETAYKNGADFFYLMNQDAWLFEDSIQQLLDVSNSYPMPGEIGILSPMHLDGSGKRLDIFLDKYIAANFESTRLISDLYFNDVKPFYEVKFINAAHWLLPKSTIETVGGFNPYFFHYGEDNEYVNRVQYHGKKLLLCPASKVIHDGKQQLDKVDYDHFKDLSTETKILDPRGLTTPRKEIAALWQSSLKNLLRGNLKKAGAQLQSVRKISKEKRNLISLKNTVSIAGATFLNTEPCAESPEL